MYACIRGKEKVVRMLIDHGADPEVLDKVHSLLQLPTDLYACVQSNKRGDGCLHYPETLRNKAILECLLSKYKQLHISVDLGSQVCTCSTLWHTYDIIVILTIATVQWVLSPFNCVPVCSCQFSRTTSSSWCQSKWIF